MTRCLIKSMKFMMQRKSMKRKCFMILAILAGLVPQA